MTEKKIREIMERFSSETKKLYGQALRTVILYGSCARGDFAPDSDIDIMVLLDVPQDKVNGERRKILDISDKFNIGLQEARGLSPRLLHVHRFGE